MKIKITFIVLFVLLFLNNSIANSNKNIQSFNKAKQILEKQVYYDYPYTFYCNAKFNYDKSVILPKGFKTEKHIKRSKRIEWEHIVPAENFGKTFIEWREGHKDCIDNKGKAFKGRKCAEKTNIQYRLMQADMYNLVAVIGSVNASRLNYNFTELPNNIENTFGSCEMKIHNRKVEPPNHTKGFIARTYFYMENAYKNYKISNSMRKTLEVWDKKYPVTKWECIRANRIEKLQGNTNYILKYRCENIKKIG